MENRFNLIDEPWIPVVDVGLVSLKRIFSDSELRALGGTPIEKIAITKLLLAIAQAAHTPKNDDDWLAVCSDGLAQHCLEYLEKWHSRFFLFGEIPFLQMPGISAAEEVSFGALIPHVATGNSTIFFSSQRDYDLGPAEQALLLVVTMSCALAGKKTDNSVVLSSNYQGKQNERGKPSSGKPGPAVAHAGLLHSFLLGGTLQKTLWLNLFPADQIDEMVIFPCGVGMPPWEQMPTGEDCPTARALRKTLMGRLVPLCRFCLFTSSGVHYSEGISHSNYKDGVEDPSAAVDRSGKEAKALWVDPTKKPWRELPALLGFLEQAKTRGFQSIQVRMGIPRAIKHGDNFALWSGGLRVSSNAGEQYVSGSDDFLESTVWLSADSLGSTWLAQLKKEIDMLNKLSKILFGSVCAYFKDQLVDGKKFAEKGTTLFWQLSERHFQQLVNSCDQSASSVVLRSSLRHRFVGFVQQAYNAYCPKETSRQLNAWAKCRPTTAKFLIEETE